MNTNWEWKRRKVFLKKKIIPGKREQRFMCWVGEQKNIAVSDVFPALFESRALHQSSPLLWRVLTAWNKKNSCLQNDFYIQFFEQTSRSGSWTWLPGPVNFLGQGIRNWTKTRTHLQKHRKNHWKCCRRRPLISSQYNLNNYLTIQLCAAPWWFHILECKNDVI